MITIHIKNLKIKTILGTKESERKTPQYIIMNASFTYDATKAINTDDLNYAIDYSCLSEKIIKHISSSKYFLIEKLAHSVLKIILENRLIKKASIKIEKPDASVCAEIHGENI